jgi:long-chain fatty acid transport protein
MLSVVHDVNQQWSVMGDLGWQDWSQFGAPQITVSGQTLNNVSRMKDTWHGALGVQYRPTEQWRLNAGVAFDSSPYQSQSDVAITLPTGDEWRLVQARSIRSRQPAILVFCRVSSHAVIACEITRCLCRKL